MICPNCCQDEGHNEWCNYHPDKAAARAQARANVAEYIDQNGYPPGAAMVWPFYKAPQVMRSWDLSSQDDADWVAVFPPDFPCPWWAEEGTAFGCCDVEVIDLPNGWQMRVGFHS